MDRFRIGDWNFECNLGQEAKLGFFTSFSNSFLSLQNQRGGIAYEFHTYEALNLIDAESQVKNYQSRLAGQETKFCKPLDEKSSFSSYSGNVKLRYRHGLIQVEESQEIIDVERLKRNDPIQWFSEINLFSFNSIMEKTDFTVKVRVMPEFFFCLARSSLFLARQVIRSLETRVFHEFGSGHILRVCSLKQNTPGEVLDKGIQIRFEGSKLHDEVILGLDKTFEVTDKILILENELNNQL